jgi:nitrogen-specific signal transduction histidine kinase
MVVSELITKRRCDFNTTICLTGVIPFLVFLYLLVVRVASFKIFIGEVGYIMFATMVVFLTGITVGRKMLWSMLKELIEKNRLAAITETALSLSHEINNPLFTVRGNIELLETEISEAQLSDAVRNRLDTIKNNCERIREVTDKMSKLSKPSIEAVHGKVRMINLADSQ